MAIYGQDYYGTSVYGQVSDSALFDASPFVADCDDYSVVDVTWARSGGNWNRQRLLRSTTGVAVNETDGIIVLDEQGSYSKNFHDTQLTPGIFYYYTLLLFDTDVQTWKVAGSDSVLIVDNYQMTQRQYDLLPGVFKSPDLQGLGNSNVSTDTSLYRFLSVIGYQFDFIRTVLDSIFAQSHDPTRLLESFLPALTSDLGLSYEPELGSRATRLYAQNAVHLYKIKGTAQCVRDVASILSGWDTSVVIGKNLVLDNPTAEQDGGAGQWGQEAVGAQITYRPNDNVVQNPYGSGVVQVRVSSPPGAGLTVGTYPLNTDTFTQRLYGVPIQQGYAYCASMYFNAQNLGTYVSMRLTWTDRDGNVLSNSVSNSTLIQRNGFNTRVFVADVAPVGAFFVLTDFTVVCRNGFAVNDLVWACAYQLETGALPTAFECSRKVHITCFADLVNVIVNPSAIIDASGWSSAAATIGRAQDSTTLLTSFTAQLAANQTLAIIQADSSTTTVYEGQTWTMLGEAKNIGSNQSVMLTAGVLRLYSRNVHVRDVIGDWGSTVNNTYSGILVSYTVDPEEGIDTIVPAVAFQRPDESVFGSGTEMSFQRTAMEQTQPANAFYFDGNVPSASGEYIWGGAVGASMSYWYKDRTIKATRLRAIIPSYLANDTCFDLLFAVPPIKLYPSGSAIVQQYGGT